MKTRYLPAIYFLFSILFATGCVSRAPQTPIHLYSLAPEYPVSSTDRIPSRPSVGVLPFESSSAIERRIMYRISPVEVAYYDFHKWVEPPGEMVTRFFCDELASSGLFSVVSLEGTFPLKQFDWLLSGELVRFEQDKTTPATTADVSVYLQIHKPDMGGQVIWRKKLSSRIPVKGDSVTDLALALEQGLRNITGQTALELQKLIERHK